MSEKRRRRPEERRHFIFTAAIFRDGPPARRASRGSQNVGGQSSICYVLRQRRGVSPLLRPEGAAPAGRGAQTTELRGGGGGECPRFCARRAPRPQGAAPKLHGLEEEEAGVPPSLRP